LIRSSDVKRGFCLEDPNKSKTEHFKLLGFKIPTIYRTIIVQQRFEKQEKVERKIGSAKKCAEVRAAAVCFFKT
jgi:hypothetical protein